MKTILICDDDPTDIKLFKKYLGPEKLSQMRLLEANSSEELYEILRKKENAVDLVFLDFYLGSNSGLNVLKQLKKEKKVPVVMLTGRGDQELAVQCMKEGAADYIPKEALADTDIMKIIEQAVSNWKVMKERDMLLGIVAHELRNPISIILGYTELLQMEDETDEAERNEMIRIIGNRTEHMLLIVSQMLDVSRIEEGITEIKKTETDLVSLAKDKVKDYSIIAARKKIRLVFSTQSEDLKVQADPDRIQEVLSNLIDNAIKYSSQDTEVKVTVGMDGERAVISVEDQGQGIKENELQYLFDLFSSKKVSTQPTGSETKTGIGLAICKKVIDAHGGEIVVDSTPGKGTKFTVLLTV